MSSERGLTYEKTFTLNKNNYVTVSAEIQEWLHGRGQVFTQNSPVRSLVVTKECATVIEEGSTVSLVVDYKGLHRIINHTEDRKSLPLQIGSCHYYVTQYFNCKENKDMLRLSVVEAPSNSMDFESVDSLMSSLAVIVGSSLNLRGDFYDN